MERGQVLVDQKIETTLISVGVGAGDSPILVPQPIENFIRTVQVNRRRH